LAVCKQAAVNCDTERRGLLLLLLLLHGLHRGDGIAISDSRCPSFTVNDFIAQ